MKPLYLYINNFTCHEASEVDFTNFSAALIIGKLDNNDRVSNGVGKTSIFKAIEYVLFNQVRDTIQEKDILLEDLILEGTDRCRVILDFEADGEIYRVARSRTTKNISDLSFYRRSTIQDARNAHTSETDKELWIDISSRRTQDTETDLIKTIKTHYKAFVNTAYFMQFDFKSGLAAATPANRKAILREALDLLIYTKLEKIAKNNVDAILKEIEKNRIMLSTIGNPSKDIIELQSKCDALVPKLYILEQEHEAIINKFSKLLEEKEDLAQQLSVLETKAMSVVSKRDNLILEISSTNASFAEYETKQKAIISEANRLVALLKDLKNIKSQLGGIDFDRIEQIKLSINNFNIESATIKSQCASLNGQLEELNIPMPLDGTCKHCRQPLSDEHRRACLKDIEQNTLAIKNKIASLQKSHLDIIDQVKKLNVELKDLEPQQKKYNDVLLQISSNEKNITDKQTLHAEYVSIIKKIKSELEVKNQLLEQVKIEVQNSSAQEINDLKLKLDIIKKEDQKLSLQRTNKIDEVGSIKTQIAVLEHTIKDRQLLVSQKSELESAIKDLEEQYSMYPSVIQAFGSTGIPSLIIQNILEDLQNEANSLLAQLRPGLQLSFKIEKTKDDGTKDDTLDIEYYLNNKPRRYSMLSGGQKVCIMFSLKLGLSFLLKKMLGSQINLLLLDEIDQPFDDSGVDAFADIIKFFQKDFTILVITHRNRLKEYFKDVILVEQGQNMISHAKVMAA